MALGLSLKLTASGFVGWFGPLNRTLTETGKTASVNVPKRASDPHVYAISQKVNSPTSRIILLFLHFGLFWLYNYIHEFKDFELSTNLNMIR